MADITCKICNRLKKEHTLDEFLSCQLKIYKNDNEIPESDWISYFNEIKSGEYSRMNKN